MKCRRGLTLLEVLASAVLLAVLAAACVPILAAAMRDLEDVQPPFEYGELVEFVESLVAQGADGALGHSWSAIADPTEHGGSGHATQQPPDQVSFAGADVTEIPWPAERADRPPVRVRRLRPEPDARHGWLVFSAGSWTACRWVEIRGEVGAGEEGMSP